MSVVNHKHGHIFIHIPKTAGASMQAQEWVGRKCHTSVKQYIERGEWVPEYISWTFVRNPYDRIVSSYHWAKETWDEKLKKSYGIRDSDLESFEAFVDWAISDKNKCIDLRPQVSFITDEHGQLAVDFVGLFENIEDDWAYICNAIMDREYPLEHRNKTNRRPWTEYYNEELRQKVHRMYEEDFRMLGYAG